MRGNPGTLWRLADGRLAVRYNKQPLKAKGKVILHLLTDEYKPDNDEKGKQKTLFVTPELTKGAKQIGMVD